jgi:PRTRC genetic system protein C
MALDIKTLPRVFKFKNEALSDPSASMSPHAVMEFYASDHPELTTATVKGPKIENDQAVYEFVSTVGVKG